MAELVDALDLGSSAARHGGSNPPFRTKQCLIFLLNQALHNITGEKVKVELNNKEELLRELTVEVPTETVNARIDLKLKEIRKTTELKGFRKGKAPMDMIKRLYEPQAKLDITEDIIKDTYAEAVREKNLKVASYPTINDVDFTEEGALKYTASVEVFPEIENVEYDGMELPTQQFEIQDDEVNEVVEALRKQFADVREVDREITDQDVVTLDIDKIADPGNVLKEDKFENSDVDLSNKLTVKEFKEQLPGMKKGDDKEIEVKYADDYPDAVFAGAQIKYKCTVKSVKERILDEANDGFAKKTGQAETLLELRMKIRDRLKHQKEEDQNREQKSLVINHICDKNKIPIPKALLEEYLKNVTADFKNQYKDQDIDEAEIRKNYEQMGTNTIRWNMLFHQMAHQEKIEVTQPDIENLIGKIAENFKITPEQAKESIQKSGNITDLRESILEDKVIDFIKSKAKQIKVDN